MRFGCRSRDTEVGCGVRGVGIVAACPVGCSRDDSAAGERQVQEPKPARGCTSGHVLGAGWMQRVVVRDGWQVVICGSARISGWQVCGPRSQVLLRGRVGACGVPGFRLGCPGRRKRASNPPQHVATVRGAPARWPAHLPHCRIMAAPHWTSTHDPPASANHHTKPNAETNSATQMICIRNALCKTPLRCPNEGPQPDVTATGTGQLLIAAWHILQPWASKPEAGNFTGHTPANHCSRTNRLAAHWTESHNCARPANTNHHAKLDVETSSARPHFDVLEMACTRVL